MDCRMQRIYQKSIIGLYLLPWTICKAKRSLNGKPNKRKTCKTFNAKPFSSPGTEFGSLKVKDTKYTRKRPALNNQYIK